MTPAATPTIDIKADQRVRRILCAWRSLTGGVGVRDADRATLVACSGGADSSALAIALACSPARLVIAHVVHDMRCEDESLGDRDAAAALAARLDAEFVERRVEINAQPGNQESNARSLRYAALKAVALEAGIAHIATGHHADDQLETMIMRLIRGAGPRGLGGIAPTRRLGAVSLIRPMLDLDRAEAEGVCELAGWVWREDRTNADTSRTRAALRHGVIPAIKGVAPDAAHRASTSAAACRDSADATEAIAVRADRRARVDAGPGAVAWDRAVLRRLPPAVLGGLVRRALVDLTGAGGDSLARRTLVAITDAIREQSGEPRCFDLRGARLSLHRAHVRMERRDVGSAEQ